MAKEVNNSKTPELMIELYKLHLNPDYKIDNYTKSTLQNLTLLDNKGNIPYRVKYTLGLTPQAIMLKQIESSDTYGVNTKRAVATDCDDSSATVGVDSEILLDEG